MVSPPGRPRVWLAVSLVLLTATWPAPAQTRADVKKAIEALSPGESAAVGPVTYTLRQRGAGTPDAEGWYRARSLGAGFTVSFPAPFNELTTSGPTTDDGMLDSHTVAATGSTGVRFNATCMRRRDNTAMPGNIADVARGLESNNTVVRRWPVAHGAMTGVGLEIAVRSGGHFRGEFVAGQATLCQLTVESSGPEGKEVAAQSARFFASFSPR